jgi:hypothetical protein
MHALVSSGNAALSGGRNGYGSCGPGAEEVGGFFQGVEDAGFFEPFEPQGGAGDSGHQWQLSAIGWGGAEVKLVLVGEVVAVRSAEGLASVPLNPWIRAHDSNDPSGGVAWTRGWTIHRTSVGVRARLKIRRSSTPATSRTIAEPCALLHPDRRSVDRVGIEWDGES